MRILAANDSLTTEHTALALGFFDGVHLGHQAVIRAAVDRSTGEVTPAVFTFGVSAGAPGAKLSVGLVQSPALRTEAMRAMGVKYLYWPEFEGIRGMSAEAFVKDIIIGRLRARVVCCGADFRFGKGARGDIDTLRLLLEPAGAKVHVVPDVLVDGKPVSSTRIREAVMAGDMDTAARLLGRPFAIDFVVEQGRHLGRTLGLPTANQRFDALIVQPRFGVYATRVTIGDKSYPAVSNVGVKPTVGSDGVLCESYIHGFSGDIYGERIVTEFIHFLRPERRFDSVEELKAAIERDAEQVLTLVD